MAGQSNSRQEDKFDDGLLFINENGYSIHFVILINDSSERDQLKLKIESRLGSVGTSVDDIGPYSVVLTDVYNKEWKHDKIDKFQIGYINACFAKQKIIDVSAFIWDTSNNYKRNFNYMNVVNDRIYTWATIPPEYTVKAAHHEAELECKSDSDSNDSFMNTSPEPLRRATETGKNTREPYSKKEKDAIVMYIVERKLYDRVKGRDMWQELERLNVCPKRTWQSMKEHAIKKISRELHTFGFLTPRQRDKLKRVLSKPKQA